MSGDTLIINGRKYPEEQMDDLATNGLSGVVDSLAYRIETVEQHFHHRELWRGIKAVPTGTAWADDLLTPFRAISGSNTYGGDADDEALVLGTDDTPVESGHTKFDLHRLLIVALSTDTPWKIRVIWGTGTMGDAITAEQFTEIMVQNNPNGAKAGGFPIDIMMPRLNSGADQVWAQAWNATDNATCDFLVGFHEYEA